MKVLIVGFGSIGKRHFEILNDFEMLSEVHIVTKQVVQNVISFKKLDDIEDLSSYDYFIISSETVKHYEQLKYICSKVNHKKILVEKPLYDKKHKEIHTNNKIFVAYNLRFHPVLQKLWEILKGENVYFGNIICGQYLPTWRLEQDYRQSYSASLGQGGGVLRDLSHELDYATWLFGDVESIETISTKISDLEINSDDIFTAIAISSEKTILNVTMDYISKTPIRRLLIHTQSKSIEADVIKNSIMLYDKDGNQEKIELKTIDRNYTYSKMHESILNNDFEMVCSFDSGKKTTNIIDNIEFEELNYERT